MIISKKQTDVKELRSFGLVTGSVTAMLFGLLLPWFFSHAYPGWPWLVSAVLILWALIHPQTLKPVYRIWMAIGRVLGWVNTRIILTVMFCLIILPVGLAMRLAGNDPMARKISKLQDSYRVTSRRTDRNHPERPF